MAEQPVETPRPKLRWMAILIAVVVPAALATTFWLMTPTVGGWGKNEAPPDQGPAAAVDFGLNGRVPAGEASDPRSIYLQNCASCHGPNLGGGRIGPALKGPAWPYGKDGALLVKIIRQGRGLTMPAYQGRLSNQQIEALAAYLQSENGVK
jgi:mono/diheme cytochrome c family protein